MAIVTISRQIGSGGDEIAARLAKELGFTLVDQGLLVPLMLEHGLSKADFEELDEGRFRRGEQARDEDRVHVDLLQTLIANLAAEKDLVVLGGGVNSFSATSQEHCMYGWWPEPKSGSNA
jgi:cytidylate kinase